MEGFEYLPEEYKVFQKDDWKDSEKNDLKCNLCFCTFV